MEATANDLHFRLTADGSVDIEAAAGDKPAKVTINAYGGGVMNVPGFGATVIDLAGLSVPSDVTLLADHANLVAAVVGTGKPTKVGGALVIEGNLTSATEAGKMLVGLARDGVRLQASVGVEIADRQRHRAGDKIQANGQTVTAPSGGLLLVKAGALREVSITPVGADSATTVSIAAKGTETMPATTTPNETEIRTSERQRLADIEKLCAAPIGGWGAKARRVDELRAAALDGALSIGELQGELLAMLRAGRATVPAVGGDGRPAEPLLLEASLCLTLGCDEKRLASHYGESVIDAAVSAPARGATFHTIMRTVLRAAGKSQPDKFTAAVLREVFEADLQLRASGFSTISLPGILSNVANKTMLDGYANLGAAWPLFCSTASHSDFKAHAAYRMTGIGEFQQIGKAGEIKHVTLGEESYTNQLETQGAMIAITRQDLINDDVNAFAQAPRALGRMSSIAIEKAVFTALMGNAGSPAFFSTTNGNFDDGADSVLDLAGLTIAERLFLEQTDANGDPVMINPKYVLVPPALSATAAALLSDRTPALVGNTTANVLLPSGNPFSGKFTPIVSPWLTVAAITGNSDLAWYLLSGGSGPAVTEVAFLGGTQTPTIESGQTDFSTLGVQMRAYHDFGVALHDYRAGVKMKGEA